MLLLAAILAQMGYFNRFMYRPVDMDDYWVTIPAGEFQMGSEIGADDEKPVHTVYLDAYQIGKYEVTNRQYTQCVKAGICRAVADVGGGKELDPVVYVTWYDANNFCEWVGGRLPTEAEWEKAARGGLEGKTYPWGDEAPTCKEGASNGANFGGEGCTFAKMPVGSFAANKYGLYDMAGNVWEWVNDWYDGTYYQNSPSSSPSGPESGLYRVLRGGTWDTGLSDVTLLRSAHRYWYYPTFAYSSFGFRCSRSP
jgi:formylglycine-generating enzyme required for sulfatase activity